MEKRRTRDVVAIVIAVLTVLAVLSNGDGTLIGIIIGVCVNVGIVYVVAAILDFFRKRT
jgi:hypothetical protein